MTKSKCIKKAIISFALATILLIIFIEDYYDQHYHTPGISSSTNIQSDKSPPIIKMYIISRKHINI